MKNILVRYGQAKDFAPYMAVCQRAAEAVYQLDNHHKTSELFSPYHFLHESSLTYWQSLAVNNPKVAWLVAESIPEGIVVGGICLKRADNLNEVCGYYVTPELQGQGVGTALWQAMEELDDSPLMVEVFFAGYPGNQSL